MVVTPTSRAASRPSCSVSFVFTLAASHPWLPPCPKFLSLSSGRFAQVCAFKLPQSQTTSASSSPPLLMGPRSRVKSPLQQLRAPFYPQRRQWRLPPPGPPLLQVLLLPRQQAMVRLQLWLILLWLLLPQLEPLLSSRLLSLGQRQPKLLPIFRSFQFVLCIKAPPAP